MAVHETDSIDMLHEDKASGSLVLSIVDHLDWIDSVTHQLTLISKINTYRDFIESGQLSEQYPHSSDRRIEILLFLDHTPDNAGLEFLVLLSKRLSEADLHFSYRLLHPPPPLDIRPT